MGEKYSWEYINIFFTNNLKMRAKKIFSKHNKIKNMQSVTGMKFKYEDYQINNRETFIEDVRK